MEKQENLHKELELIQSVISRIANNSFLIKGWTMTLMSALIAFGKDSILGHTNGVYYLIMMIGVLIPFWWLDAYYLKQERIFRKVYEKAIADPKSENRTRYDLNPREMANEVKSVFRTMWAGAIRWFYIPFILLIALGVILKISGFL
jgi:hypothetical protein